MKSIVSKLSLLLFLIVMIACQNVPTARETEAELPPEKVVDSILFPKEPFVEVYVENSISMDGYVYGEAQEETPFKNKLYGTLVDVKSLTNDIKVFYINSDIHYCGDEEFVKNLNKKEFQKFAGKKIGGKDGRNHTSLVAVIDSVMQKSNDSTVSILVSDFISDQGFIENSIKKIVPDNQKRVADFAVIICRYVTYFDGKYCYPEELNMNSVSLKSDRPYFLWVFGPEYYLVDIQRQLSDGAENYCCFTEGNKSYDYKVVRGSGNFELNHETPFHAIEKAKPDPKRNNEMTFEFDVNFKDIMLEESYYTNPENYTISDTTFEIKAIHASLDENYTHRFKLTAPRAVSEKLVITLNQPQIPDWVKENSDKEGTDLENKKTYKLEELVGGVAKAFCADKYTEFEISINLKNK